MLKFSLLLTLALNTLLWIEGFLHYKRWKEERSELRLYSRR